MKSSCSLCVTPWAGLIWQHENNAPIADQSNPPDNSMPVSRKFFSAVINRLRAFGKKVIDRSGKKLHFAPSNKQSTRQSNKNQQVILIALQRASVTNGQASSTPA
ncbi:MAG: hypothetical protein AB7T49_21230 [Oligoflexales bacterium]